MTELIPLRDLTASTFISGKFASSLPEIYQLQDVIEIQDWHDNQSVFDHLIKSRVALDTIIKLDYLVIESAATIKKYLDQRIDEHTRIELLGLATLLHDIGKLISLQRNTSGNTSSPSHGIIGSWIADPVLKRLDLSDRERIHVAGLISDHLVPSDLIEMSINNKTDPHHAAELLHDHRPNSSIELLLLAYSDWMGCTIKENKQDERDKRIAVVHECLQHLVIKQK